MYRSPSTPGLGSSVTSKRTIGHCLRAAASSPPVPGAPVHEHLARRVAGSTGWAVHSRRTGAPSTRATAHSTCEHTASGLECTYMTPRVGTADLPETEVRLPLRPRCAGSSSRRYSLRINDDVDVRGTPENRQTQRQQ